MAFGSFTGEYMMQVWINAICNSYCFSKDFDLSTAPQSGGRVWVLGKRILLQVKHITQDADRDLIEAFCEATLEQLWELDASDTGWISSSQKEFRNDPKVRKAVEKHKARMEAVRREIAKAGAR